MLGQFFGNVYRQVVFFLGIYYFKGFELTYYHTGISYLTSALCIEWGVVKHQLVQGLAFLLYLTITQNGYFVLGVIITNKCGGSFFKHNPVARFNGCCITGSLFLLLHFGMELFNIRSHSIFSQNELGEVKRKSKRII